MADNDINTLSPVAVSDRADKALDTILKIFEEGGRFAGYEKPDALKSYLDRNGDAEVQKNVGPAKEMWVALKNDQGIAVGAINQQIFVHDDGNITVQHSYVMAGQNVKNARGEPIEFSKDEQAKIATRLYALANDEVIKFAEKNGGDPKKIYTFAVENSPALSTKSYLDENAADIIVDNRRLNTHGFKLMAMPYVEVIEDKVTHYNANVRPPQGVEKIPTALAKAHQEKYLGMAFDVTLENPNFKAMNAVLDRPGFIALKPIPDAEKEIAKINTALKKLPDGALAGKENTPVGELSPELNRLTVKYYGKENIAALGNVLPVTRALTLMDTGGGDGRNRPNGKVSGEEAGRFINIALDKIGKIVALLKKESDGKPLNDNQQAALKKGKAELAKLDVNGDGVFDGNDVKAFKDAVLGTEDKRQLDRITQTLKEAGGSLNLKNVPNENSAQLPTPSTGNDKAAPQPATKVPASR